MNSSHRQAQNTTHETVAATYTEMLQRAVSGSCCGTGSTCLPADPPLQQAADAPDGWVGASFGCGNPLAFAEVQEGETVVDLGSGAGLDLLAAAGQVGHSGRVIGVDMTEAMLQAARRNIARSSYRNVEVRQGLIEELPVDDESADWVISNCVINLSPHKSRVFSEIQRVLRPGGRMLVSDIVVEGDALPESLRHHPALHCACVAGAISEAEYLQGLRDAGLTAVQVVDRLVYDAPSLKGLVQGGEFPELQQVIQAEAGVDLDSLTQHMEGKVTSIRIHAQKAVG